MPGSHPMWGFGSSSLPFWGLRFSQWKCDVEDGESDSQKPGEEDGDIGTNARLLP